MRRHPTHVSLGAGLAVVLMTTLGLAGSAGASSTVQVAKATSGCSFVTVAQVGKIVGGTVKAKTAESVGPVKQLGCTYTTVGVPVKFASVYVTPAGNLHESTAAWMKSSKEIDGSSYTAVKGLGTSAIATEGGSMLQVQVGNSDIVNVTVGAGGSAGAPGAHQLAELVIKKLK